MRANGESCLVELRGTPWGLSPNRVRVLTADIINR